MIFISSNFNFRASFLFFFGLSFAKMSFLQKYSCSQMVTIRSFPQYYLNLPETTNCHQMSPFFKYPCSIWSVHNFLSKYFVCIAKF